MPNRGIALKYRGRWADWSIMMNLRRRRFRLVGVVAGGLAGLLLVDSGWLSVSPAAASPVTETAAMLPTERGEKGDPGPLESVERDFAAEFPSGRVESSVANVEEGADGEVDGSGPAGGSGVVPRSDRLPSDEKRLGEVVEKRTATSETYALDGGGFVTDISLIPKRYRDADGEWAPVDNRVVPDRERDGVLRNAGAAWSVRFGVSGDGVSYEIDGKQFGFKLKGAADVEPVVDENDPTVVWYREIWPGVDVSYRVSEMAVKEDFHVASRDALKAAGGFPSEWTSSGRLIEDEVLAGGLRVDWDGDGKAPLDDAAPKVSIEPVSVQDASGRTLPEAKGRLGLDLAAEANLERGDGDVAESTRPLTVELDPAWVESLPDDAFPLVVDPTVNISPTTGGGTWASYDSYYGNSIGTSQFPLLGDWWPQNVHDEWRFGVAFDYSSIWSGASSARVRAAQLQLDTNQYPQPVAPFNGTVGNPFYNQLYDSSPNAAAVGVCHANAWNFSGMWMGVDPAKCKNWGYYGYQPVPSYLQGHPAVTYVDVSKILRPWVESHTNLGVFGVKIDTTSNAYTFHASMPTLSVSWDQQTAQPVPTAPAADSTVTSLTPTLAWNTGTDPDAGQNPPLYQAVLLGGKPQTTPADDFELSGCTNGASILWKSGTAGSPYTASLNSVQIPSGILSDGATYYWAVAAIGAGGIDRYPRCSDVRKFTVNRRLGASGPFPVEQLGPVGVNLITGNMVMGSGTHSYGTVGGGQSLSFVYNSQRTEDHGLRARYYGGVWPLSGLDPAQSFDASTKFADRIDSTVDFAWGGGSPVPTMDSMDNFSVRWTGYVTVPTAASYCFGGAFDDRVKIQLNGVTVLNQFTTDAATVWNCSNGGTAVTFAAGETKSIQVDYFEHKGDATAALRVQVGAGAFNPVDPSWLTPELNVLGPGWTMSTGSVAVQGALKTDTGVVLRSADGSTTEYKKSDTGAYTGPAGDGTVVRVDPNSAEITVLDDAGTSYRFSPSGELLSAVTASDDRQPAATQYGWSGAPVKMTSMVDPVGGGTSTISYWGGAGCSGTIPSGYSSAPSKICRFTTPDGRNTDIFYDSSARLARVVQPGGVTTDYAYGAGNRITEIRDPSAFDAVSAGVRTNSSAVNWVVDYDPTSGKVTKVTAPAPAPSATREESTVTYGPAATGAAEANWGYTSLSATGVSQPNGYAKRVHFDDLFRTRRVTDAAGRKADTTYDGVTDRVSYTDTLAGTAAAMRSSTTYESNVVFNGLSRPNASYGPAPVGLFNTNSPTPVAAGTVPTTITGYDGGINGLAAAWWDDNAGGPFTYPNRPAFIGAPKAHTLVGGNANWSWGTGSPDAAIGADNWSGRLTGLVYLPTAGSWRFAISGDDGARLTIDDTVVADVWTSTAGALSANYTLGVGWHRIVLEIREDTGGAGANVWWMKPGTGTWDFIPGGNLKPDLGLVTASADNRPSSLPATNNVINQGEQLHTGQSRTATNGAATLIMQGDGNLVLYGQFGPMWSTGTGGNPGSFAVYDWSGNLIVYSASSVVLWQSGTWPGSGSVLIVQDDGNFVGYRGPAYWATNTFSPPAPTPPSWVTTTTAYADPIGGQPTSTTVDSGGLGLVSTVGYEARGTTNQYMRRTSRSLPAGASSTNTYTHFGAAETPTAPTCAGTGVTVAAVAQRGLPKTSKAADPTTSGGGGGLERFTISDVTGRTVATKTAGDAKWSCVAYDSRGRVTATTYPASASSGPYGERTVTSAYAIGGDPMLNSVTDPAGTITTRVDLLGRVTDTKDTLGIVTHTDYDVAGRPTQVTVFNSSGTVIQRSAPTYNTTGAGVNQLNTQRWSNAAATVSSYNYTTLTPSAAMPTPGSWTTLATAHYDTSGRNDYTDYQNGVRTTNGFDTFSMPVSVTHTKGAATLYSDVITRDITGRVIDRAVNGTDPRPGTGNNNYLYDSAGRLTDWWERDVAGAANVSGTYRFAYTGGTLPGSCTGVTGANVLAGRNSNRVEQSVTTSGGTVNTVYCYDFADRLRKVSPSSGANPYSAGFVYDAHGNTTTVGTDTMSFDGANRHLKTVSGATTVEYTRDAAGRIVTRSVNGTVVSKQAYTGAGDTSAVTLSNTGTVKEITVGLTGGGLYTWRPSSATVWSHGNTHGDLVLTTNSTGTQTGTTGSYDPFGNPLGTTAIDNSDGNFDYGWHGQAQRPLEHETNLIPTIQMGARPYQTALGRFLATDPIEGGTLNDYLYAADPVNQSDLDGRAIPDGEKGKWMVPRRQGPNTRPPAPGAQGKVVVPRRRIPSGMRKLILEDGQARCVYCQKPAVAVDHHVPRSQGGLDVPENFDPVCTSCNSSKGARMPPGFSPIMAADAVLLFWDAWLLSDCMSDRGPNRYCPGQVPPEIRGTIKDPGMA